MLFLRVTFWGVNVFVNYVLFFKPYKAFNYLLLALGILSNNAPKSKSFSDKQIWFSSPLVEILSNILHIDSDHYTISRGKNDRRFTWEHHERATDSIRRRKFESQTNKKYSEEKGTTSALMYIILSYSQTSQSNIWM